MTIQSDIWIEEQCKTPTHVKLNDDGQILEYLHLSVGEAAVLATFHPNIKPADELYLEGWKPMIAPFYAEQVREIYDPYPAFGQVDEPRPAISYGVSSFGYDVRCGEEFEIFTNINGGIVDPKNFDKKFLHSHRGQECIIPPNSFALARTIEWFKIPRDILTICLGKSTYARCGIIVNVTPLEPEWEGQVTLEFSNTTSLPAKIYANEGVAQMLFLKGDQPCRTSYKDRGGKYQGQSGVTLPKG
jgi:dCTP deaminase